MTVEATRRAGFATAVKGSLGWQATCTVCPWSHIITGFAYKGDAQRAADAHNLEVHGVKR